MLCIGGTFEMLLASLGATNLMLCWSVVCGVIFWVYGDANLCNGIIKFRFAVLNQRHASRLVPQRFEFIAYLMWWQGQGLTICRQGLASMANLPSFFSNVCEKFEFFFSKKSQGSLWCQVKEMKSHFHTMSTVDRKVDCTISKVEGSVTRAKARDFWKIASIKKKLGVVNVKEAVVAARDGHLTLGC